MSRRHGKSVRVGRTVLCFLAVWMPGSAFSAVRDDASSPPRFTAPPPAIEPAEVRRLIDRAKTALQSGQTVSEVLSDETFLPVRAWPRFRALIRQSAPSAPVTLVPAIEPGERMQVRGIIRDVGGQPVVGAILYVYHTSAKGWYSERAPHISGDSGDTKYARLFAYLKTDAQGRYEFRTIRPAGYPASDLPAHIHIQIDPPQGGTGSCVTEIRFEDDPRLTRDWRDRSRREGCLICEVKRGSDRIQRVTANFRLR
jgi:hypothetical protein